VKKNLELKNVNQEDPKGIAENLENEGEEEELTSSSRKGKSNKELPTNQIVENPFKRKRWLKSRLLTESLFPLGQGLLSSSQDMVKQNNANQVQVSCTMFRLFQIYLKAFELCFFITLLLFLF
jgi:hypothetical protein